MTFDRLFGYSCYALAVGTGEIGSCPSAQHAQRVLSRKSLQTRSVFYLPLECGCSEYASIYLRSLSVTLVCWLSLSAAKSNWLKIVETTRLCLRHPTTVV